MGKEIHLISQNAAIGEDQVFRLVGYIRCVEQEHMGLLWRSPTFALVATAACGDHIHPGVRATLGYGHDVVPGQAAKGQVDAAIGADLAIPVEEFAVGKRGGLDQGTGRKGFAPDGDNAVGTDFGALTGFAADAAMHGETL